MNRKDVLNKRMLRLDAKKKQLEEKVKASTDAADVRAMTEQLEEVNAEIAETRDELAVIEAEERANDVPAYGERLEGEARNGAIVASFVAQKSEARDAENVLESMEYREAFRELWTQGKPMSTELMARARAYINSLPEEQRAGMPINTSNTSVVIPLTIMREVINKIRTPYGNIYDRVRKTAVPGAVEYPVGEFEADFHWVTEGTVSPEQDIGAVGKVSFGYFEAELRIAQTFLSSLLSIDAFEAEISNVIARAYRKFMDNAIVNGDGNGKITGLAVSCPTTIKMTAAQLEDWKQWDKNFFAKLIPGYEDGVFVFARSTVISHLKTMSDANNRPLFYEATGLTVGSGDRVDDRGYFYGREILMTVPAIVQDFDTASENDTIGYYFQPDSMVLNENFGFAVDRFYDFNRRKWITIATIVVDGKPINNKGFIKITKG